MGLSIGISQAMARQAGAWAVRVRDTVSSPLQRLRAATKRPMAKDAPVVVLVHGLNVPRQSLALLQWRLERQYGRRTLNVHYPRLQADIPEVAASLARQVAALGVQEFDAVTHSMGGIVLRWAMNHMPMPTLRRAVMIAPPNGGAWLADHLSERLGPLFPLVFGQAGLQLRRGEKGIVGRAGLLRDSEVGIIAGGSGTPKGKNNIFRIPGDADRIVAVEETILPGMKDFVLLNLTHSGLLISPQTAHMANLFLDHGIFRPNFAAVGRHHE